MVGFITCDDKLRKVMSFVVGVAPVCLCASVNVLK